MPLFVWAALALAALLVSGSVATNIGSGHAVVVQPSSIPAAMQGQSIFPWYVWLLLGSMGFVAIWIGIGIIWGRR